MGDVRRAVVAVLLCGCVRAQPPGATTVVAQPRVRDCPDAPALEMHAMPGEAPGEAFGVGGHVLTLALEHDDETVWLTGSLDVKGTLAFEAHTRTLAMDNYHATVRGEAAVPMALTLRGRAIAYVEVPSAMRGGRFRLRVPVRVVVDDALTAELDAAVHTDRRCFPGR